MRPRVLLDADVLSEVIKSRDAAVLENALAYAREFDALTFTSISVLEILHGMHRKLSHAQISRAEAIFARNEEIVPMPDDYRLAAEIAGALWRAGTPIGLMDPLIAACAIRRGYGVATGNTAHFGFIRGAGYDLRLEDWRLG
jgi:tRNA(fMet)-specific endonuclease VapC